MLLFISILIPVLLGNTLLVLIFSRQKQVKKQKYNFIEFLCWSYGLGAGLVTFSMFILVLLKVPFSLLNFNLVIISLLVLGFIFIIVNKKNIPKFFLPQIKISRLTFLELILILVILFEIGFVFSEALSRPIFVFDTLTNWAFKAKIFFFEESNVFNPLSPLSLAGASHLNYPLHGPFLMAWVYLWLGEINETSVNLIFAFYFLSLLGLIYFSLRHFVPRKISLIFTMFLSTMPLFNYHGFNAYVDLPFTFYFTGAVIFLFRYFKEKDSPCLILAGLWAGLASLTKNEGLMLSVVLLIVFGIYLIREKKIKTEFKNFLFFIFYFLFLTLPWIIFKIIFHLGYSNVDTGKVFLNQFHPEIFDQVFRQIFLANSFHLWPGIFLLIFLIKWRQVKVNYNFYLFFIILITLAAYFVLYLFTSSYQFMIDGTAFCRNMMVLIPTSIFLAALLVKDQKTPDLPLPSLRVLLSLK